MGPTGNSSHKPMLSPLCTGCFSYTPRSKSCLRGPPINPCSVHSVRNVSLTHPDRNHAYEDLPKTHAQSTLYGMFLLHIQIEIMPTRTSHIPMPSMLSTECLSTTFSIKRCFRGTPPTNAFRVCSERDVCLVQPG